MSHIGNLSDFLDATKQRELAAVLWNLIRSGKTPIFKVYVSKNETVPTNDIKTLDAVLPYLTLIRQGKLLFLVDVKNDWITEEETDFDFSFQMKVDQITLTIPLAKIAEDDSDFPLIIHVADAAKYVYSLG